MVPEPCRGVGCLAGVVGRSRAPVLLPVNTSTAGWVMFTCARLPKVSAHLPRSPPVQRSHLRVFGRLLCQASSHLSPGPRPSRTLQSNSHPEEVRPSEHRQCPQRELNPCPGFLGKRRAQVTIQQKPSSHCRCRGMPPYPVGAGGHLIGSSVGLKSPHPTSHLFIPSL